VTEIDPDGDQLFVLHSTIKKSQDTEGLGFNTATASMTEFTNAVMKWEAKPRSVLEPFVLLLSPYAPHLAEELWQNLGHNESLAYVIWPEWKEVHLEVSSYDLPVQINGKMRGTVTMHKEASEEEALAAVQDSALSQKFLSGKKIKKVIFVPDRIINVIVQ